MDDELFKAIIQFLVYTTGVLLAGLTLTILLT